MDSILQAQFERVETALTSLVDSIASYNPSTQAAQDLVAADDELSVGLDELSQHQANHARILALRSEAEALETQLRSSIVTLAALRRELLETPTTKTHSASRPVSIDELLQYAAYISNTTVPPTYREPIPQTHADKDRGDASTSGIPTNAVGTPAMPSATAAQVPIKTEDTAEETGPTQEQAEWLKEMQAQGMQWRPFPDDFKVRSGNLMTIQFMLDQGKDPWTDKVPTQQEVLDAAQREQEEEEQRKKQEEEERQRLEQEQMKRREAAATMPRAEPQPVQQFTGFDFGDDED